MNVQSIRHLLEPLAILRRYPTPPLPQSCHALSSRPLADTNDAYQHLQQSYHGHVEPQHNISSPDYLTT